MKLYYDSTQKAIVIGNSYYPAATCILDFTDDEEYIFITSTVTRAPKFLNKSLITSLTSENGTPYIDKADLLSKLGSDFFLKGSGGAVNPFDQDLNTTDNVEFVSVTNNLTKYNTTLSNPSFLEGRVFYDTSKKALSYYNEESDITVNLGQEVLIPVFNNSGEDILNGSVVYPSGVDIGSGKGTIGLADASLKSKSRLIALATHTIEDGTTGYITRLGEVGGLNTVGLSGTLYLSDTTPGAYTMTPPSGGSYVIPIGGVGKVHETDGTIVVDPNIPNLTVEVTDTNGFTPDQRTNTSLSFTNSSRQFNITASLYPYHYYVLGDKFEHNTLDNVIITDVEGSHYIYYDGETLTAIANPSEGQVDSLIRTKALVAAFYWNASDSRIESPILDERHGISMSPQTHSYLHFTQGAKYLNGLGLGDINADDNTPDNSAGQFSIASGLTVDEDLITSYSSIASTIGLPIYYLNGANGDTRRIIETGFSVLTDVTAGVDTTGRLVYNEWTGAVWQLTPVVSGNYVLCHVFAINGTGVSIGDEPTDQQIAVVGQNEYSSAADARLGATTEISNIISGLASPEIVPVATLIFETKSNYTGSDILARVVSTSDGDYTDWRTSEIQAGATASSHTNLTNVDNAATGIIQGHVNNNLPLQIPELTTTERDAVVVINNGMLIYNTTTNKFEGYENGSWTNLI